MDWFVNGFGQTLVLGTVSILLCNDAPLDFIKDCVSVFFIFALDDYSSPATVTAEVRHDFAVELSGDVGV